MSRSLIATAIIALVAAIIGAFVGQRLFVRPPSTPLHQLVHHDLELDVAQRARIDVLEAQFGVRKRALDLTMRAANAELASAIQSEQGYGPRVKAAVDHFHAAMGELQKETIEHVFAMRAVMTPAQAAKLDRTVTKALTADPV